MNSSTGPSGVLAGRYWVYCTFDNEALTVWRVFHTSRDTKNLGFHAFENEGFASQQDLNTQGKKRASNYRKPSQEAQSQ